MTRRERERISRRNDIITAARHIFAKRGYQEATLEEIAGTAEFGKGTIYNYFKSKEDLFCAILDETFDDIVELTKRSTEIGLTARDKLKNFAVHGMRYYRENRDFFILLMREANQVHVETRNKNIRKVLERLDELLNVIAAAISKDIKAKRIKSFDPVGISNIFLNMVHGFLMRNMIRLEDLTDSQIDAAADLIISVFFEGVSTER
ncbi:MAG: TetR/AcrR family transcriptional regulator [Candidatus Kryptoniota bacterium]